jgi:hypothetical protein
MVQVVIEIITDTVFVVFETRNGLQPLAVSRELPKAALTRSRSCLQRMLYANVMYNGRRGFCFHQKINIHATLVRSLTPLAHHGTIPCSGRT